MTLRQALNGIGGFCIGSAGASAFLGNTDLAIACAFVGICVGVYACIHDDSP